MVKIEKPHVHEAPPIQISNDYASAPTAISAPLVNPLAPILTPSTQTVPLSAQTASLQTFTTRKGTVALVYRGYTFYKKRNLKNHIDWTCSNKKCTANLQTNNEYHFKSFNEKPHDHEAPPIQISNVYASAPTAISASDAPVTTPDAHVTTPDDPVTNPDVPFTTPDSPVTSPATPESSPQWCLFESQRGTECLRLDNYCFYKLEQNEHDDILWRCSNRNCKARVVTSKSTHIITLTNNIHIHEAHDDGYFSKLIVRQSIKRKIAAHPDERPMKATCDSIEKCSDRECYVYGDIVNFNKCAGREKLRGRPALPKSHAETIEMLKNIQISSTDVVGARLIKQVTRDVVLLATDSSLELLQSHSDQVYADGTFKFSPKYFYQFYTFHICKDEFYIPVAFFLLRGKSQKIYEQMLKMLKMVCGQALNITTMTVDFEMAMISATRTVFPFTNIRGCRFHLAQAWQRKFRELGFQREYNSRKGDIAGWLKKCFGLPVIDSDSILEFFEEFASTAPSQLKQFIEYLRNEYVSPNSTFPPHLSADIGRIDLKFTTNMCENWHRHFSDTFKSPRPNIFVFLQKLEEAQCLIDIKSWSKKSTPSGNVSHIKQMYNEMQNGNIDMHTLIANIAIGFQPIYKKTRQQRAQLQK